MTPPVLFLKNIALTFGGKPLFTDADLQVEPGARIALVGRNGSGKSTLLKIAAGRVEADFGERFVQPGATLRYLEQEPDLSAFETVGAFIDAGLAPGDDPYRGAYLLEALGVDAQADPKKLSGGEIRRAALARALAPQPDILLLDEPTNHLDLPAIEWLEAELRQMKSALVIISHDRRFLSGLTRETVWMDRGVARHLDKGFETFESWRDTAIEEEETEAHKLERKIVREEHWVTHGVSGRRKRNIRRLKELGELRRKLASREKTPGIIELSTAEGSASGKLVAELKNASKSYEGRKVVSDFSTIIMRGERIGIVGPNGAGKTTLVGLITGKISPDSGNIRLGINLETLVIDQKRDMLKPDWTLKDALTDGAGDTVVIGDKTKHVMSYMKDFLFLPEQARTPVSALSGGERGRLMLARGLRTPCNFLILDEPTNDLDLETLDLLQEFLADFDGTVLLVSHDRDFLDRICTSVIASDGDGIWHRYAGGYSDMVAQKGSGVKSRAKDGPGTGTVKAKREDIGSRNTGETDAKAGQKRKLSFKEKHALESLPGEIETLESEIRKLKAALSDPDLYSASPEKFNKFTAALEKREAILAEKEDQWLELEDLREQLESGG